MFFIHGQMKQKKRNKIILDYSQEKEGFLFTTDVLARGIDFPDVNWIVQIDPPQVSLPTSTTKALTSTRTPHSISIELGGPPV